MKNVLYVVDGEGLLTGINGEKGYIPIEEMSILNDSLYLRDAWQVSSLPDNLTICGNLWLRGSSIKSLPNNLTVMGSIYASDTQITLLPGDLKVGSSLILSDSQIASLPNGLVVPGNLFLDRTPITQLPDDIMVGFDIYLRNARIAKLPDNLIVGGSLDLRCTSIEKLPNNLAIGGNLWISKEHLAESSDNLVIGGRIYSGYDIPVNVNSTKVKHLHNGDYVQDKYLYADGILTAVKRKRQVGDYTVYVGLIKNTYVVSDGKYYAHCESIKQGVKDIAFKKAKDRGSDQYKNLTLESRINTQDAIMMYRIITGACQQGTQKFVDSLGETLKESYTVAEIMEMTKGGYGNEVFCKFFNLR